jgi:hypothetical protein
MMRAPILCLAAAGFLVALPGFAQADLVRSWGAIAGLSLASQTTFGEFSDYHHGYAWGGTAGVSVEWQASSRGVLSCRTEALYVQKGHTDNLFHTAGGGGSDTRVSRVNYVSVPVLLVITDHGPNWSPYLVAGPSLEIKIDYEDLDQARPDRYALGGVVGLGINKGLGAVQPAVEVRYTMDVSDPRDDPIEPYGRGLGSNRAILILGGIRFQ